MEIGAVVERVRRVAAVRDDAAAPALSLESALVALREITSWAEAQQASRQ